MKNEIPTIGKTYKFYDDGKASREFEATVVKIIPFGDASKIKFKARMDEYGEISTFYNKAWKMDSEYTYEKSLLEIWKSAIKEYDWIYTDETDYFIGCSIPKYDDNIIWFARKGSGGWYSFDIQSCWQGGFLDTIGIINDDY